MTKYIYKEIQHKENKHTTRDISNVLKNLKKEIITSDWVDQKKQQKKPRLSGEGTIGKTDF